MEGFKKLGPYKIIRSLGSSKKVFQGQLPKSLENYAIKHSKKRELLKKEFLVVKALSKVQNSIQVYEYAMLEDTDFFVMELLGDSIFELQESLTLECISAIGLQILEALEQLHSMNLLHRDIQPKNFVISLDKRKVHLVGYSSTISYQSNGKHKTFKHACKRLGNPAFASLNCHNRYRYSRRDDLESLILSLIYLFQGTLPWIEKVETNEKKKWKKILEQKISITDAELFSNIPQEFSTLLSYCRELEYEECPDYSYIKGILNRNLVRRDFFENFDWVIVKKSKINRLAQTALLLKAEKNRLNDGSKRNSEEFKEDILIVQELKPSEVKAKSSKVKSDNLQPKIHKKTGIKAYKSSSQEGPEVSAIALSEDIKESLLASSSKRELDIYNCLTERAEFPEFLDRPFIFGTKKIS